MNAPATPSVQRTRPEIEKEARRILAQHGLLSVPVDPVVLASKEGIQVNNAVFADEQIAGMIAKRKESVTLLVKQDDHPYRKRFTIAHELGHHFLHLAGQEGERIDTAVDLFRSEAGKKEEVEANQFAAALLMPKELVEQELALRSGSTLEEFAARFRVSGEAMGIRLATLGLELSKASDAQHSLAS